MSRDDDKLTGRAAIEEIDRRLGGLLGPLAEGLAKVVDAAEKAQGGRSDATVQTSRGPVSVRSGLTVRVGGLAGGGDAAPAGRDPAQPTHAEPRPAAPQPVPEPPHDVFETATEWSLTADLPGAAEADLAWALEDGTLSVETTGARRWRLSAPTPDWLRADILEPRLSNGVLEMRAIRPEGETP